MPINKIEQTADTTQISTLIKNQEQKPKEETTTNTTVKKDTVVLSEAAKDLAAFQAGKSAQEEAKESFTSRLKEETANTEK